MRLGKSLVLSKTQRKISAILSRSISRILLIYNFFKGKRKGGISGNFRHIESKIWKISVVIIFQSRRAGGGGRKEIIRARGNDINARKDRKRWIGCYWIIARIIKMEIRVENSFHSAIVGNIGKYFLERKLSGLARAMILMDLFFFYIIERK